MCRIIGLMLLCFSSFSAAMIHCDPGMYQENSDYVCVFNVKNFKAEELENAIKSKSFLKSLTFCMGVDDHVVNWLSNLVFLRPGIESVSVKAAVVCDYASFSSLLKAVSIHRSIKSFSFSDSKLLFDERSYLIRDVISNAGNLEKIDLSYNGLKYYDFSNCLWSLCLKSLDISGNDITLFDLANIKFPQSLEELGVSCLIFRSSEDDKFYFEKAVKSILSLRELNTLDFSGNYVYKGGAVIFCKYLLYAENLVVLCMSNCCLGTLGVSLLYNTSKKMKKIKRLELLWNEDEKEQRE